MYNINDVVQFTENHKWRGCLGIIEEIKECGNDIRYMIGVPIPQQGTSYIFVMKSEIEIEYIEEAVIVSKRNESE